MNFMRDNFRNDNKKRKISTKDINFFQKVREGSRTYGEKVEGSESCKVSCSGSSIVGRTFLRPTRKLESCSASSVLRNELSVLSILNDENKVFPFQSSSCNPTPEQKSFFSDPSVFGPSKRPKTFPSTKWGFKEDQNKITETSERISDKRPANMYIEETAEKECHHYRANIERMRAQQESKVEDSMPGRSNLPEQLGRVEEEEEEADNKSYRLSYRGEQSTFKESSSSAPRISSPEASDCPTPQLLPTPSGQMSSLRNHFSSLSPPLHPSRPTPQSSSFNTKKFFFSDVSSGQDRNFSKGESFFKIPSLPGSTSDQFETLFSTPEGVKSLPRITTPQLFLPYQKSTPSKTTPQTKSSSKTTASVSQDSFYVISITEGRGHAMGEVGIAAIDLTHPVLLLCQFSDSQTYKKTLAKINVFDPAEMLVPDTFKGLTPSVLYKTVTETFPDMRVMSVKRQHYSAKLGLETIRYLQLPESSSIEMMVHRKYYTLAAAEALMKYVEIKHGKLFAPKSLKVNYQTAKDIVTIDLDTCQRLELVMSNAEMVFPEKYSLFGLLNYTKTLGGKRRLRVSLLQPSSSINVLRERLEIVAALANDQHSLEALQTNLLRFSNVERLLWLCLKTPNFKNEAKTFETLTNYILLLKTSLEAIPHLCKVLEDIDNDYITNIRDDLTDNKYEETLMKILRMIQEDAKPARGYAESEKQRCFAVKEGVNDLLDVARATYSDIIQQVMDNISDLGREHGLPLRMTHSADLGFHPSYLLPKNAKFQKEDIPEIFTEVKLKSRTVHLLTEELYIFNMRIKRALQEIQLITNVVIYDLVEDLRENISLLYRLCDYISDLDFLACIAQVSSSPDFTKPIFTDKTSLVGARHPILDHVQPSKPIPNNVFASKKKNFNIITGPNMGGKTVYVLMIPLIQIMAQIGCYVPADKAEIRITDHIYVKKGSDDSMEQKLSSFMKETKELSYTIDHITHTSLIILDEICSGTLSDEGTAMAWGFCEEFIKRSAFTFLTTHYHYLTNLSKIYKNVTNYNMEAIERPSENPKYAGLTFTYRLLPGVTQATNYALRLLLSSALPEHIKKNALEIAEDLVRKRAASLPLVVPETPGTSSQHTKIEKIENFMTNLYGLSMTENFTEEMVSVLQRMAIEEILSGDEDEDADEVKSNDSREQHQESSKHYESSRDKENLKENNGPGDFSKNPEEESVMIQLSPKVLVTPHTLSVFDSESKMPQRKQMSSSESPVISHSSHLHDRTKKGSTTSTSFQSCNNSVDPEKCALIPSRPACKPSTMPFRIHDATKAKFDTQNISSVNIPTHLKDQEVQEVFHRSSGKNLETSNSLFHKAVSLPDIHASCPQGKLYSPSASTERVYFNSSEIPDGRKDATLYQKSPLISYPRSSGSSELAASCSKGNSNEPYHSERASRRALLASPALSISGPNLDEKQELTALNRNFSEPSTNSRS